MYEASSIIYQINDLAWRNNKLDQDAELHNKDDTHLDANDLNNNTLVHYY